MRMNIWEINRFETSSLKYFINSTFSAKICFNLNFYFTSTSFSETLQLTFTSLICAFDFMIDRTRFNAPLYGRYRCYWWWGSFSTRHRAKKVMIVAQPISETKSFFNSVTEQFGRYFWELWPTEWNEIVGVWVIDFPFFFLGIENFPWGCEGNATI